VSDERLRHLEWINHVAGCEFVGIDDDTCPCECPVISSSYHDPRCTEALLNTECKLCWPTKKTLKGYA
jgi:hypothetical protein